MWLSRWMFKSIGLFAVFFAMSCDAAPVRLKGAGKLFFATFEKFGVWGVLGLAVVIGWLIWLASEN